VNILQVCHRIPFPPLDGGNIAMEQVSQALRDGGHSVKILALNTSRHPVAAASLPQSLLTDFGLESVDIDTRVRIWPALVNIFRGGSYNISRFDSAAFREKLREVLHSASFDIVQLESLYVTPFLDEIRRHSRARIVLRAHNVEYMIWKRMAAAARNPLKRWYLSLLARRLEAYERDVLRRLDAILAITPEDKKIFNECGFTGPAEVIPVSVTAVSPPARTDAPMSLFHLGSMDWMPNVEAVEWFLDQCWPAIHRAHPAIRLYLAGRGFPDSIRNRQTEGVLCEGEIRDAAAYMSDKPVMIVPLLSGSGMRVKIIEGMAAGKVIISTAIGAEGIDCADGIHLRLADTPGQFLEAVTWCIAHPDERRRMAVAAQQLVQEKYTRAAVSEKLNRFYARL
jgi:glycosyltransferase involved in cell wall biosynthesis